MSETPKPEPVTTAGVADLDREIAEARASLDASIQDHSHRIADLTARRQLALVGEYIARHAGDLLASGIRSASAGAMPRASEPASPAATVRADAPSRPRHPSVRRARRAATASPDVVGAAPATPAEPDPTKADPSKPKGEVNPLVLAAYEALKASDGPMTAAALAKSIGIEPRRISPYTAALLKRRMAVRSDEGLFSAA